MRIGIDIDDTITDTHSMVQYYKSLEYPSLDPKEMLPSNLYTYFLEKYLNLVHINVEAKKGAKDAINELKKDNEIIIVTLRDDTLEERTNTINNLEKHGIKYDEIYFGVVDKGALAKRKNIDLFIDDRKVICEQMKKNNIKVIKFKRWDEYNNEFIEFDNWLDILKYIKEDLWKE